MGTANAGANGAGCGAAGRGGAGCVAAGRGGAGSDAIGTANKAKVRLAIRLRFIGLIVIRDSELREWICLYAERITASSNRASVLRWRASVEGMIQWTLHIARRRAWSTFDSWILVDTTLTLNRALITRERHVLSDTGRW
jgi:hypothetical protein